MDALESLLETARSRNWCVQPYCTTCGARDYRRAIAARREELISALRVARLGNLWHRFPGLHVDSALRLLMMELAGPGFSPEPPRQTLDERLAGTEAGDYLAGMRAHHRRRELAAERHAREHDPAVMAERRRVRKAASLERQLERARDKAARDASASSAMAEFRGLSLADQLQAIAQGRAAFPLYRMPVDLVEHLVAGLAGAGDELLQRLEERVPRTSVRPLSLLSVAIRKDIAKRGKRG